MQTARVSDDSKHNARGGHGHTGEDEEWLFDTVRVSASPPTAEGKYASVGSVNETMKVTIIMIAPLITRNATLAGAVSRTTAAIEIAHIKISAHTRTIEKDTLARALASKDIAT